jgi:DNA-binding CsgD family transcriptional regulator
MPRDKLTWVIPGMVRSSWTEASRSASINASRVAVRPLSSVTMGNDRGDSAAIITSLSARALTSRRCTARLSSTMTTHRAPRVFLRRLLSASLEKLSPQELQIARIAGRGQNNLEVAAALFLSRKTVEAHLTRGLSQAWHSFSNRTCPDSAGQRHSRFIASLSRRFRSPAASTLCEVGTSPKKTGAGQPKNGFRRIKLGSPSLRCCRVGALHDTGRKLAWR